MAVIWGLDLNEIKWSKFQSSHMWGGDYHLRRTKFIAYQLAMIFCVVSESLGTAALSNYLDEQDDFARRHDGAEIHGNDYIGVVSFNIFVGVFVATIFGAAFFFDLFWPARRESLSVRWAWRICAVLAAVMALASALAMTVILATRSSWVSGLSPEELRNANLGGYSTGSPLVYRKDGKALASVILIWPGWIATVASAVILCKSYYHNDRYDAYSTHKRKELEAASEKPTGSVDDDSPAIAPAEADPITNSSAPQLDQEGHYTAHNTVQHPAPTYQHPSSAAPQHQVV